MLFLLRLVCSTMHLISQLVDLRDGLAKNKLHIFLHSEIQISEKVPTIINRAYINIYINNQQNVICT